MEGTEHGLVLQQRYVADIDNSGPGCQELPSRHSLISLHIFTDRQVSSYVRYLPFLVWVYVGGKVEGCFGAEDLTEMLQVFSK